MKRILCLILCLLLVLGLFAGCREDEGPYIPTGDALDDGSGTQNTQPANPTDQQLTLACYFDRSLNPYTATDLTNRTLLPLLYQGLFSIDRNYQPVPILCDTYSMSPDMKTYTFTLCDARFSDGTEVTPVDVMASLEAAKKGSYYSGRFQHITNISVDNDAVIIQLDTPFQNLPLLLDIPIVRADEVDAQIPTGSGPYVMDDTLAGKQLRRQAAWWCKTDLVVTAPHIPLVAATSTSQIRDQFEFADVGLVCADPGSDSYADYRCDYEIWDCENGLFLYLVCNSKSEIFSNDTVRQALTHAIDRDALVNTFYRGFAMSTTLPVSPLSPFYNKTLAGRYEYDSLKFTDALTEAGLQGSQITFLVNSDDSLRVRVGRYIANVLREYGLVVNLQEMTTNTFIEHLRWGTYDLYLGQTKLSPNMDLSPFFARYGSLNYGGLADTTIYTTALDALANSGNYYNLHKQVMEDAQLCPLLVRTYAIYATRGLLTQLNPSRDNVFFYTTGRTLADAHAEETN